MQSIQITAEKSRCLLQWVLAKSGRHTLDSGKLLPHHLAHSRNLMVPTIMGRPPCPVKRAQVLESELGINSLL